MQSSIGSGRRCRARRMGIVVILSGLATAHASVVRAESIPVFRTPGDPYSFPQIPTVPNAGVGNGVAIVNVQKSGPNSRFPALGLGMRGLRWSVSDQTNVELGNLGTRSDTPGFTNVRAFTINPSGTAGGYASLNVNGVDQGTRPVRWDAGNLTAVQLPVLNTEPNGTAFGEVHGINAAGVTVGFVSQYSALTRLPDRAMRWSAGANPVATPLDHGILNSGSFGTVRGSVANGINASGTAVGTTSYSGGSLAVRWDAGGTAATVLTPLTTYPQDGSSSSQAIAINRNNVAIGFSVNYLTDNGSNSVRWDASGAVNVLHGINGADSSAYVRSINDRGNAVGYATAYDGIYSNGTRALRWASGTSDPTRLDALPGTNDGVSAAYATNNADAVAGSADIYDPASNAVVHHAVLWDAAGHVADLNQYVSPIDMRLEQADAINDAGWVSGIATYFTHSQTGASAYQAGFLMLVPSAGTYGQGDANFDSKIDFSDLLVLAKHYNATNKSLDVFVADLNLDGVVDFADLLTLAKHYGQSDASLANADVSPAFAADWALAQSLVPEPTLAGTLLSFLALARRRRTMNTPPVACMLTATAFVGIAGIERSALASDGSPGLYDSSDATATIVINGEYDHRESNLPERFVAGVFLPTRSAGAAASGSQEQVLYTPDNANVSIVTWTASGIGGATTGALRTGHLSASASASTLYTPGSVTMTNTSGSAYYPNPIGANGSASSFCGWDDILAVVDAQHPFNEDVALLVTLSGSVTTDDHLNNAYATANVGYDLVESGALSFGRGASDSGGTILKQFTLTRTTGGSDFHIDLTAGCSAENTIGSASATVTANVHIDVLTPGAAYTLATSGTSVLNPLSTTAGDSNYDGKVDFVDLLTLAKHYNTPAADGFLSGDFDRNGSVGFADLLALAKHYGSNEYGTSTSVSQAAFDADWQLA